MKSPRTNIMSAIQKYKTQTQEYYEGWKLSDADLEKTKVRLERKDVLHKKAIASLVKSIKQRNKARLEIVMVKDAITSSDDTWKIYYEGLIDDLEKQSNSTIAKLNRDFQDKFDRSKNSHKNAIDNLNDEKDLFFNEFKKASENKTKTIAQNYEDSLNKKDTLLESTKKDFEKYYALDNEKSQEIIRLKNNFDIKLTLLELSKKDMEKRHDIALARSIKAGEERLLENSNLHLKRYKMLFTCSYILTMFSLTQILGLLLGIPL